jgi:hypothetical protein
LHKGSGVFQALARTRLRAALNNAVVLPGSGSQLAAFPDIVRNRLLYVHVLTGLSGGDRDQGVRVIRRGD